MRMMQGSVRMPGREAQTMSAGAHMEVLSLIRRTALVTVVTHNDRWAPQPAKAPRKASHNTGARQRFARLVPPWQAAGAQPYTVRYMLYIPSPMRSPTPHLTNEKSTKKNIRKRLEVDSLANSLGRPKVHLGFPESGGGLYIYRAEVR